jgi:Bacterial PH domain
MTFTASYDGAAKIISAGLCLVLLAIIAATHSLVIAAPLVLIILVAYAYSPRGYVLTDRSILVQRLAGPARIPLEDVREVRRATPDDFRLSIRIWASGGAFGYYGLFSTATLGKSTWYVTNRDNRVVVITGSKTALFSPDDVNGFLNAIRASAPIVEGYRAPLPHRSRSFGTAIGAAIGIAAIGLVAAGLSYSPGTPGYTLTPTQLAIHDRFYPVTLLADNVDVSQVRIVDLARDAEWRPTSRTNGFANWHYQSGWFRVAAVQKNVRLYRSGGERLVLLPPNGDGVTVLYQAKDPEAFVSALRAAWSVVVQISPAQSSANAGK